MVVGLVLSSQLIGKALQLLVVKEQHLDRVFDAELRVFQMLCNVIFHVLLERLNRVLFQLGNFGLQLYHLLHEGLCLVLLVVSLEYNLRRFHNQLANLTHISEVTRLVNTLRLLHDKEIKQIGLLRCAIIQFILFEKLEGLPEIDDDLLVAKVNRFGHIFRSCPQKVRVGQVLAFCVLRFKQTFQIAVHFICHGSVKVAFHRRHFVDELEQIGPTDGLVFILVFILIFVLLSIVGAIIGGLLWNSPLKRVIDLQFSRKLLVKLFKLVNSFHLFLRICIFLLFSIFFWFQHLHL